VAFAVHQSDRCFEKYPKLSADRCCGRRLGSAVRARPAAEPLTTAVIEAAVEVFTRPEPDRAGLSIIMSTPELPGAALKAFTLAEEPLAEAIAERTGGKPGDLSSQALAAAVAGAIRVAGQCHREVSATARSVPPPGQCHCPRGRRVAAPHPPPAGLASRPCPQGTAREP
jgi:MftR C-terminal domain